MTLLKSDTATSVSQGLYNVMHNYIHTQHCAHSAKECLDLPLWFCFHSQKPLMVIHHREDCTHSQGAAVTLFVAKKSIQEMAKKYFIMHNLVQNSPDCHIIALLSNLCVTCLSTDPTTTVCADIAGKYNNRRYTYMPGDMALCE
uniref:Uncharacterized protein n=1 Tax=Echeneis naucrates TaxID=173247 RepID=A0A665UYW6_ECHNA